MYKAQREQEIEERQFLEDDEARKRDIIEMEKERLLALHGHILNE